MNENLKTALAFAGIAILIVSAALLVYGLVSWTHTYTWETTVKEFEVYTDAGFTTLWTSGESTPLTDPTSHIDTFYIKNIGNVDVTVTGVVTAVSGSVTSSWSPSNSITLIPDGSGALTLTLSSFSASGEATLTFTVS